jgi:hypothetical protein
VLHDDKAIEWFKDLEMNLFESSKEERLTSKPATSDPLELQPPESSEFETE